MVDELIWGRETHRLSLNQSAVNKDRAVLLERAGDRQLVSNGSSYVLNRMGSMFPVRAHDSQHVPH